MQSGLGSLLWFVAIIAMIPLALWLLKRSPLMGAGMAGAARTHGTPRAVAVLPLSAQQKLVTVEVGRGDARQWLVLGVSPQGIRTLHTMPAMGDAPDAAAAAAATAFGMQPNAAFSLLLQRLRGTGAPDIGPGKDKGGHDAP